MALWIKTPDGTLEKAAGAKGAFLPLTGGTLTGDLQVGGKISGTLAHQTHAAGDFIVDNVLGMPGALSDIGLSDASPNLVLDGSGYVRRTIAKALPSTGGTVTGDLQVDGKITVGDLYVGGLVKLNGYNSDPNVSGEQPNLTLDANGWVRPSNWSGLPSTGGTVTGDLQVDGKITNAEVKSNTDELALRGIIGVKKGSLLDSKISGGTPIAYRALTLRPGRRFRMSGTINVQKGTADDGYEPGFLNISLRIDNNTMYQQSIWLDNNATQSVHIEWTGHALSNASGGSWQGVALHVDATGFWGYVGTYQRAANLIIEDVGPWKDLNDNGRTTTELEHPETLDLDEGDYEIIELPAPY